MLEAGGSSESLIFLTLFSSTFWEPPAFFTLPHVFFPVLAPHTDYCCPLLAAGLGCFPSQSC